jgi:hypothetical protein
VHVPGGCQRPRRATDGLVRIAAFADALEAITHHASQVPPINTAEEDEVDGAGGQAPLLPSRIDVVIRADDAWRGFRAIAEKVLGAPAAESTVAAGGARDGEVPVAEWLLPVGGPNRVGTADARL